MRTFTASGYLLRYARIEVRLIYTGFLVMACIGMLTMAGFQLVHIGPTPERIAAYYRGGEVGGEMHFAKSVRELVEVTHFHSFIMGLVYLVMAHLFIATSIQAAAKRVFVLLGFAGLVGDLLSPWLIRYVSSSFAYALLLSWVAEWIGFAAFIAVPIAEMWFSRDRREFPPE